MNHPAAGGRLRVAAAEIPPPGNSRRAVLAGEPLKRIAGAIVVLLGAAAFLLILAHPGSSQWDLRTFHAAARAFEHRIDPYNIGFLGRVAELPVLQPYLYPPVVLWLLSPLARLPYEAVHYLWLALKCLALVALLAIWRRNHLRSVEWPLLLAVTILGFNGALIWDLRVGNVSLFEQVLLWGGLACLGRRRLVPFVVLISLSALFKLTPIVFLGLLLLPAVRSRRTLPAGLACAAAFILLVFAPFPGRPELQAGFRQALVRVPVDTPSSLGLIGFALRGVARGGAVAPWMAPALWVLLCGALLFCSRRLIRAAWRCPDTERSTLVFALLYALLTPRLPIYSQLVFVPPLLGLILPEADARWKGGAILVAFLCLGGLEQIQLRSAEAVHLGAPFLVMLGCWIFLARTAGDRLMRAGVDSPAHAGARSISLTGREGP